jgi:hypothetical protein
MKIISYWQLKFIIKNILAFFIITSMIWGGSGIELFKHICLSHSVNKVSILDKPLCNHESKYDIIENCCGVEEIVVVESSCCENENNFSQSDLVSITNSENCCESFSELKKIEEFLFPPVEKKVLYSLSHFIISQEIELSENSSQIDKNFQNKNLPTPVFGRSLLNLIHQLKIDTPTC